MCLPFQLYLMRIAVINYHIRRHTVGITRYRTRGWRLLTNFTTLTIADYNRDFVIYFWLYSTEKTVLHCDKTYESDWCMLLDLAKIKSIHQ